MLNDNLFYRLARRFRRSLREESNAPTPTSKGRKKDTSQDGPGFFNNAKDFVVNQSTFIENRGQIINNFGAGTGLDPVLERIMTYANLDASVDSSARFPPPTCHPGTRLKIGNTLFTWLVNPNRKWNLIWLNGPAGTGKSAVAQTFAERCAEEGRLGASFFFSRPNKRNDPDTVIPTLVYQLAVCHPPYKALVMAQLANDPAILRKTRRAQFQKLIVEPFSQLQAQEQQRIQKPLLVVLDGLDECKGENAQREIVEIIGEVARLKKGFPLVWLISSRPEPHLKYLFSRADFTVHCGREELAIDAESIADVDFYIRDGLAGIKADFSVFISSPVWPPDEQIVALSQKASGHFGFAWTSLRYIGDRTFSSPMSRLDNLLSFLSGVKVGTSNPLEALDALYTAIFEDVPNNILPTTMQILAFDTTRWLHHYLDTVQHHCNFLHIDQATFYNAFQQLHSVIDVPPPEFALQRGLKFYHASFEDYLKDPSRSGKFAINLDDALLGRAKLCLSWYKTDLELFHITDGPEFNESHKHGILPGLSWVSGDNRTEISRKVARVCEVDCWYALETSRQWDETLLSQIRNFDFRYIQTDIFDTYWRLFLNRLWDMDSSGGIIRTEPCTEIDLRLLEYMKSMVGPLWGSTPATFPLERFPDEGEYFFVGYECKTIICWVNGIRRLWCSMLNSDEPPSKERIDDYQAAMCEDSDSPDSD